jgi:pimeloyl-ACP methyl ester carboxylesterase
MIGGLETRRCTVAGHEMAYYRSGRGEPVLLVHGITTYSFMWRNILPSLAEQYDVIAVDLLGCGASDMPLDISYALTDHADYLHEFVTALGLSRLHLVGHDLGGGICQIFAARYSDDLLDVCLLNTVGYDFWPVQPISAMRTPIIRQLLVSTLDLGMMRLLVKRGIHHQERVTPALMALYMAPFQTRQGRRAFLHFARCLDNSNLMAIREDLSRLGLPVLIMRGEHDVYLNREIARKLHDEIPDSRLVSLPTAGHYMQEDEPERIVTELMTFFGVHRG